MSTVSNIAAIARREATVRVRTRSFIVGTLLLVLGTVAIAMVPVVVQYVEGHVNQKVLVYVSAPGLKADPVPTLQTLLNARPAAGDGSSAGVTDPFTVTAVSDLAAARASVVDGQANSVLAVERAPGGDLAFTLYTNDSAGGSSSQLIQQAATAIAVADRLDRLGVAPADQATLFSPPAYAIAWPDPARTEPTQGSAELGSSYLLGFGMTILIFMMIILYGNWVAMSVVEEKSSRVMEVILNAATPFQLLAGKVLGVGTAALVQYLFILAAGAVSLLLQGRVADLVLGQDGGVTLPEGLTVPLLILFCIYGVLGFLLYAVLYAAAGSLVSRQEDISSAVMPMTLVTMAGYFVAVYSSTGLLDIRSGWIEVLSLIPFFSPFIMLGRVMAGGPSIWEVLASIAILVLSIGAALWLAARVYAAGVLLYGQRPGWRAVWRIVRAHG